MKDKYIIECKCKNPLNDFGMHEDQIGYYNIGAQTYKYLTRKFSSENKNPYLNDYFNYTIPITPNINNATIYKNIATAEKIKAEVEAVGDFTCRIMVLKTTVEPLNE